MLLNNI